MEDKRVIIRLTLAEAVVLDEVLRRYSETERLTIMDQAEQRALWNLQCLLERDGSRPLWPSLQEAQASLRDSME